MSLIDTLLASHATFCHLFIVIQSVILDSAHPAFYVSRFNPPPLDTIIRTAFSALLFYIQDASLIVEVEIHANVDNLVFVERGRIVLFLCRRKDWYYV